VGIKEQFRESVRSNPIVTAAGSVTFLFFWGGGAVNESRENSGYSFYRHQKLCQILISVPAIAPLPSFTRQNAAIKHKQ
jgi:hypothetical protein